MRTVQSLISWKHSFRKLGEEYETARKKKQALDTLLENGRISQSTHDLFNIEITEAMTDIERQQKTMLDKMNAKVVELEEQVKTLEILFANFEIQHVTGEVDDEAYQREIGVLSMGLETSKNELEAMKEATEQLSRGSFFEEQQTELQAKSKGNKLVEEIPKPKMAYVEVNAAEEETQVSSCTACAEEAKSSETASEGEEEQQV